MLEAALKDFDQVDFVVATAAVADFAPEKILDGKIRREGVLNLELKASTDVLAELGKQKTPKQIMVGFAAEVGEGATEVQKAKEKLERKNLDLLAFNNVSRRDIGFDVEDNEILLFSKDSAPEALAKGKKELLAKQILLRANALQEKRR
jgi:phosphopantothenoylcysteine decarboxylase/phosphopantothenate--cysteine ligase